MSSMLWLVRLRLHLSATELLSHFSMMQLYAVKQRTRPFERSELLVNRLIKFTIETGSACAMAALVQLGLFAGMPAANVHLVM